MECYACSNEPTRQCRRCARVYCELHGGDLCAECLSPASSLPSFNLYRGSLLALLVGTAIALWLIVRPPGTGGPDDVVLSQVTTTPIVTEVADTPEPDETVEADETSTPDGTSTPSGTPRPDGAREYVVQDGDTLLSIAEATAPPGVDAFTYAERIAFSSGLTSVDDPIQPGDTLVLPP